MVDVVIDNSFTHLVGLLHSDPVQRQQIHEALRQDLGYMDKNAKYSPAFKIGDWDGLRTLYIKRLQRLPAGLTRRAIEVLKGYGVEYRVFDRRPLPRKNFNATTRFAEMGRELRFYQELAVERSIATTRGILALFTGAGKTITSCETIARAGVKPVVFVVPTQSLMYPTRREFEKYITVDGERPEIGMVGDGTYNVVDGINVCVYHSLLAAFNEKYDKKSDKLIEDEHVGERVKKTTEELKREYMAAATMERACIEEYGEYEIGKNNRKKLNDRVRKARTERQKAESRYEGRCALLENKRKVRELIASCQLLIIDEAHLAAVVIQSISEKSVNAYYKIGNTATPFREDNQEIRIEAALGKKLIEISPSEGIDLGYLVPLFVFMVRIRHIEHADGWRDVLDKHVVHNWERNYRIKQFAEGFKAAGWPVMIIVDDIDHGQILEEMVGDSVFVCGSDDGKDHTFDDEDIEDLSLDFRKRILDDVEKNNSILIATSWVDQGIDAPKLRVLIRGGSGRSTSKDDQRAGRVLRCDGKDYEESCFNGKDCAVMIDFYDEHPDLRTHSVKRKKNYQRHPRFTVQMIG